MSFQVQPKGPPPKDPPPKGPPPKGPPPKSPPPSGPPPKGPKPDAGPLTRRQKRIQEERQSPPKPKRHDDKVTPKKQPLVEKNTGAIPKKRGKKLVFSQDPLDASLGEPSVPEQPDDEFAADDYSIPDLDDVGAFGSYDFRCKFHMHFFFVFTGSKVKSTIKRSITQTFSIKGSITQSFSIKRSITQSFSIKSSITQSFSIKSFITQSFQI